MISNKSIRFNNLLLLLIILGPPAYKMGLTPGSVIDTSISQLNPSYLFHIVVWIISGVYSLFFFRSQPNFRRWFKNIWGEIPVLPYFLFIIISVISCFYSIDLIYSLYFASKLVISFTLICIYAWSTKQSGYELLNLIIKAFQIGFILEVVLYVVIPSLVGSITESGYRLTGGFLGDYGSFALMTLFGQLQKITFYKQKKSKLLLSILIAVFAWYFILLSKTRTIIIVGLITTLIFILSQSSAKRKILGLFTIVSGILIISFTKYSNIILTVLLREQSLDQIKTLSGRTYIFNYLIEIWKRSPWIGYGFQAGVRNAMSKYVIMTGLPIGGAHDALSKALVDTGILGTFVLISSLLACWVMFFITLKKNVQFNFIWPIVFSLLVWITATSITSGGIADVNPAYTIIVISLFLINTQQFIKEKSYYSPLT
jgi:O-antigen ligase